MVLVNSCYTGNQLRMVMENKYILGTLLLKEIGASTGNLKHFLFLALIHNYIL